MEQENRKRRRTGNSDMEIPIKNQIQVPTQTETKNQNENENEKSQISKPRKNWKNLSLLQTLEQYDLNQRNKRGEIIATIVREFFLPLGEKTITNSNKIVQFEWQKENPMEKALGNPLVVKMIIGHLNCSSLLNCRLVNKLWLLLCTERLSKSRDEDEDALRLNFRHCDETGTYIKNYNGIFQGKIKTLDAFNEYLLKMDETARSQFPCVNFELTGVILSQFVIKNFFQLLGTKIKGLRIGFSDRDTNFLNAESFTDLFMNRVPNVECLTILQISSQWSYNIGRSGQSQILNIQIGIHSNNKKEEKSENEATLLPIFTLRSLRCLRILLRSRSEVLMRLEKEIILSSPRLKKVEVEGHSSLHSDSQFDFLTSISKSHLIQKADIRPELNQMSMLNKFSTSRSQPKFKQLSLHMDNVDLSPESYRAAEKSISFAEFLPFASALLQSSQETLESFSIPTGKYVFRLLKVKVEEFPPLEKVRFVTLSCREKRRKRGRSFPIKEFNRIFPSAIKLELHGQKAATGGFLTWSQPEPAPSDADDAETNKKCEKKETETKGETLKPPGVMPQITNLSLHNNFTLTFMNNFPLIFPNLVELELENHNLLPILPLIWTFTSLHLKKLKLQIPCLTRFFTTFDYTSEYKSTTTFFPGLDTALTGFPEEACVELLSLYPKILDEETVKEIRINSSILDLKYLEELHIKFQLSRVDDLPQNILSVVSGVYAFERMRPKVQIHIETQVSPEYQQKTSALASKNQQIENVLKPLLLYANNFTCTLAKTQYYY